MESSYKLSALKPDQLPPQSLDEIALLGRSNSGKSSFINTFLNRRIAKTSKLAGRTQTINFFDVDHKMYLVDIPGYGFARSESKIKEYWQELVETYLKRDSIRFLIFITDIRRELNDEDIWVLKNTLNAEALYIILNKSDKLSGNGIVKQLSYYKKILNQNGIDYKEMFTFSSINKKNLELLQKTFLTPFDIKY